MKWTFLTLFVSAVISSHAFALGGTSSTGSAGDKLDPAIDDKYTPTPIPTLPDADIKALSFSQLKTNWDHGTLLSEQLLLGGWHLMAYGRTGTCLDHVSRYNFRGLKNEDGLIESLFFKDSDAKFLISVSNYTSYRDGIYKEKVEFSEVDPSQPRFSRILYANYLGNKDDHMFFHPQAAVAVSNWNCRGLPGDKEKLVCTLNYSSSKQFPEAVRVLCPAQGSKSRVSVIAVYKKMPPTP